MVQRLLIVEDDCLMAEAAVDYFTAKGWEADTEEDGIQALEILKRKSFHLILLDVMIPGMDGFALCGEIRRISDVPIIFITARVMEEDKLNGYALGADDYIEKPFDTKELVARVKAVLRRYKPAAPAPAAPSEKCVQYADLSINLTNYSVVCDGRQVEMPPKELELLYFLAASPNQVFTREQLLDQIWGYEYIGDTRTVDVHIKRLREKIKDHPGWSISTVWGIGYKFDTKSNAL